VSIFVDQFLLEKNFDTECRTTLEPKATVKKSENFFYQFLDLVAPKRHKQQYLQSCD
jgi:hypothetical protein